MTVKDALDAYRERFPNDPYTDGRLCENLSTLDSMAQTELLGGEGAVRYNFDTDGARALLLSETAFEDIYPLYLGAMSFFDRQDWLSYSNAKVMFNTRYLDAQSYYARTSPPESLTKITNLW